MMNDLVDRAAKGVPREEVRQLLQDAMVKGYREKAGYIPRATDKALPRPFGQQPYARTMSIMDTLNQENPLSVLQIIVVLDAVQGWIKGEYNHDLSRDSYIWLRAVMSREMRKRRGVR